jgi:hypothetical protein
MTTSAPMPIDTEVDGTAKSSGVSPGLLNRYSPTRQVGIVVAAIIPTIVIFVGFWFVPSPDDPRLFVAELAVYNLVYGTYFVALIWLVNKYPRRRNWALTAAILTVVVDTGLTCYSTLFPVGATLVNSAWVAITVAYVAVWGIARRQYKSWLLGLPFAAIVPWVAQSVYVWRQLWWESWTGFVGSLIVGCLFCWAFDLLARRIKARGVAPTS